MPLAILHRFRSNLQAASDPEKAFDAVVLTAQELGFEACVYLRLAGGGDGAIERSRYAGLARIDGRECGPALIQSLASSSIVHRAWRELTAIRW